MRNQIRMRIRIHISTTLGVSTHDKPVPVWVSGSAPPAEDSAPRAAQPAAQLQRGTAGGTAHPSSPVHISLFKTTKSSVADPWHCGVIRIRIRGSMPLNNGSGFGSCYFRHWPSRRQLNNNNKKFFCLLLFEGTFTSQNRRNQGFTHYFCLMIEGSGSESLTNGSGWP